MSAVAQPGEAALDALRLRLPPRWQLLDPGALVAVLGSPLVEEKLHEVAPDENQAMVFLRALPAMLRLLTASGVVLTAVRARGRSLDLLTLALPGEQAERLETIAAGLDPQEPHGPPVSEHRISLAHGDAIERRTSSCPWSGANSLQLPARVELVFTVPPARRGAIISVLSSQMGDEELLAEAAREIADSLELMAGPEPAAERTSDDELQGGHHG